MAKSIFASGAVKFGRGLLWKGGDQGVIGGVVVNGSARASGVEEFGSRRAPASRPAHL